MDDDEDFNIMPRNDTRNETRQDTQTPIVVHEDSEISKKSKKSGKNNKKKEKKDKIEYDDENNDKENDYDPSYERYVSDTAPVSRNKTQEEFLKEKDEKEKKKAKETFALLFNPQTKPEGKFPRKNRNNDTSTPKIENRKMSEYYEENNDYETREVYDDNEEYYEREKIPEHKRIAPNSIRVKDPPMTNNTNSNSLKKRDSIASSTLSQTEPDSKLKEKCMSVTKFCVKQMALIGLVLLYAVAGAFLFALLEQHNEQKSCQESKGADMANVVKTKAKLIEYVQFNITTNVLDKSKDNETYAVQRIEEMLTEYRDEVLSIGYDGSDCEETKWILINGILFCLTVVTTIGYGQVFPVTWEGQIVCICYATLGIPLFLMCLANISSVLGFLFRWMYVKVCCGICNYRKKKKIEKMLQENESSQNNQGGSNRRESSPVNEFNSSQARIVDDNEDLKNEMNDKDDIENVSVPLTITILVITFYIGFGAIMFKIFEGWEVIESAYFCFVTLSTIGFGDFVPGQNFQDPLGPLKLAAGCVYILLGLAILGMSFDLMQEEIISKFTWLGKKIGLLEPDEDEEEEEEELEEDIKKTESPNKSIRSEQKTTTVNEKN